MGGRRGRCNVNTPRIKWQYAWEKTGGLCWYCGARLYYREEADTKVKKRLVFNKAKRAGAPLGKHGLGRWKIKAGTVVFYFELARLSNGGSQLLFKNGT